MATRIKVGALPDEVVTGRLSRIAPQAQRSEGATLFDVEAELDPGNMVTLRAGYSANADVVIREKTEIVLVPERLVIFSDDGTETFVEIPGAGPDAEPKKIAVTLGLSDGLNVEVVDGVMVGDEIVQRPPKEIS
jgi:HlyD family secretion protein